MLHDGTTGISEWLTHKQAQSQALWEKNICKVANSIYLQALKQGENHKNKTDKQIMAFLKNKLNSREDWYLDAEQAVENGLADGVLGWEGFEDMQTIKSSF